MPAEPGPPEVPMTSEEDIRRATIGPVVFRNAPIVLVGYDPRWPAMFDREADRIRSALASLAIRVEHVGSTSVPGLAAKPIIDIVLAVPDSADEAAYVPALEAAGYRLHNREPGWLEHRLLNRHSVQEGRGVVGGVPPDCDVNLHVLSAGEAEIDRMVLFRDWLRSHDDDRDAYVRVKRELAQRTWRHVQHYADAKTAIVQQIMARASLPAGSRD
jgi:GrpB-like predicted nucleotidyltransferase (UPF0157 family)